MAKLHGGKFKPRRVQWHALWIGTGYNPRVMKLANVASGAYAIREKATHEVQYVGESSRGTIWKTLLRHVQAPMSFREQRETGVLTKHPSFYEVALHITSRGHRPRESSKRRGELARRGVPHRTDADQKAMAAQARWIASMKQQPADVPASMVMMKPAVALPAAKTKAAPRAGVPRGSKKARAPREVLKAIEAGPSHSLAVAKLAKSEHAVADELVAKGHARRLPKRGRWPDRYVVTALGSHELGTLASTDESFRADAREAGALERERRAKASRAKPAGFGSAETKGKKAGQLKLFNPAPEGALVLLGKLTRLEPMKGPILRWSLRQAPWLVYDDAGRLFIVYDLRRIVRSSTPAEMREYGRTHWGQHAKGNVRDGGVAVGPFVRLGAAKSITYTTKKGTDSELVDYVHPSGEGASLRGFIPPQIVEHECLGGCGPRCAARGALALHGGSYRVTSRGIVG